MHHHGIPASGDFLLLLAASFFGSAHCVGMCGPYVALCAARISPGTPSAGLRIGLRLLFNAGRIATYTSLGVLAGSFGQIASAIAGERFAPAVALAAGLVAVVSGIVLLGRLADPARFLARAGLDRFLREGTLQALRAPPYRAAILLGALQGAFPCALVYGALARASAAGSPLAGGGIMLIFGLGTVPAIFALASLSPPVLTRFRAWRWAGGFILVIGFLLLLRGLAGLGIVSHTLLW